MEAVLAQQVLYVLLIVERPGQWVRAWKPEVPGIHEVFHARFVDHAYPAHTHDAWTVFTVDEGSIAYDLERRHRGVARSKVTLLPPHVVHDGRPAVSAGYRKRVLYVGTEVLGEHLIGPAVDEPDVLDPSLVRGFRSLHQELGDPGDAFEAESTFALVAARLAQHLGERRGDDEGVAEGSVAEELRDLLDARFFDGITLAEAGRILEVSPARLARSFTSQFRISPHRYLVGRRIEVARRRLLEGDQLARVAVDVGFHDQAHFTKHFKRHVGTTPGCYRGHAA
ncbi:MAG: AraC family transcriptional regulator [Actinomycetota bacterium]